MKKLYVGWMILYDPSVHRELYKANIDTALYLDIINGDDICFEQRFHHWLLCAGNNSAYLNILHERHQNSQN